MQTSIHAMATLNDQIAVARSFGVAFDGQAFLAMTLAPESPVNNPLLYNAAFSGYVGGIAMGRSVTSDVSNDYDPLKDEAAYFAGLVDGNISTIPGLTQSQVNLMAEIVGGVCAGRSQTTSFSNTVLAAIVTAIFQGTMSGLV
jgi:hypothetical protein